MITAISIMMAIAFILIGGLIILFAIFLINRQNVPAPYPTAREVNEASNLQLRNWIMWLPEPVTEEEKNIIALIKARYIRIIEAEDVECLIPNDPLL